MSITSMTPYTIDTGSRPVKVKLKASDLPLSSATRAAIEGLAHTFKKKGGYDSLRKQIWDDLMKTSFETNLTESLVKAAEIELEKNEYDLLKKSRSAAQALIHGAVERAGVYRNAEQQIDALIDLHITEIEDGIRTIRKIDIGEELAAAELVRGSKTDEQYAEEARQKREAREKLKNEAKMKEIAAIEEKRKEEQKKAQAELEKRTIEREARRKAEREREEKKERDLRDRQRREREKEDLQRKERERKEKEREAREKEEIQRKEQERKIREKEEREKKELEKEDRHRITNKIPSCEDFREPVIESKDNGGPSSTKPVLSVEEIESLELEALNHLLKPTISRTRHKLDLDIDDSLAPPPRKLIPSSAIQPISRDSPMRSDLKKPLKPLKKEMGAKTVSLGNKASKKESRSSRDRSPDRNLKRKLSNSRSRSRSLPKDSKDRELRRSRLGSRERPRNEKHRNELQEREDSHRDQHRRRHSKETENRYHREHKREHRSESVESTLTERKKIKISHSVARRNSSMTRETRPRAEDKITSSAFNKKSSYPHDKNKERYERSRSRTPQGRRRIERSLSPPNIDRYVPGAHGRSRRESKALRSPARRKPRSRSRSRSHSRDRNKVDRCLRDEQRSHRPSHIDSHNRQKDRSRDRERIKERRSRSPYLRRERDKRRERSRSRDRDRYHERERERDRGRDRDRSRDRHRGRERKRLRSFSRERDREKDQNRNRSRSRGSRRDSQC